MTSRYALDGVARLCLRTTIAIISARHYLLWITC